MTKKKYVLAKDEDFKKVKSLDPLPQTFSSNEDDYEFDGWTYIYQGSEEYVEIPHYIDGELVTSYDMMFSGNQTIKGVISTNPHVERMDMMFSEIQTPKLELLVFNTSSVTSAFFMFEMASIGTLEVHDLDFPGVDMKDMIFDYTNIQQAYAHKQDTADYWNSNYLGWAGFNFDVPVDFDPNVQEYTGENGVLPYRTVHVNDYEGEYGKQKLIKEGVDGEASQLIRSITSTDGTVHNGIVSQVVLTEPIHRTFAIGTGPEIEDGYTLAKEEDFVDGKYVGPGGYVKMPFVIGGRIATDYRTIFERVKGLKGVMSKSPYVTDMWGMFGFAEGTHLDLSRLNTSNVTDMNGMFQHSTFESIDLSGFDTSNVEIMAAMFGHAGVKELDLSNFDTSNVEYMNSMFWFMPSLKKVNLNSFQTTSLGSMHSMFRGTEIAEIDMSSFDISNVTSRNRVFDEDATKTVYVGTEDDIHLFESIEGDQNNITFKVGGLGYIPPRTPVSTHEETQETPIPYTTEYVDDPYLSEGEEETIHEGADGVQLETIEITTYDDGSTTSEVIDVEVLQEPLSAVVHVGVAVVDTVETITEETPIPFDIERIEVDTLYQGEEKVIQEGVNGVLTETIEVTTFTNGETFTEVIGMSETEPVTQIIEIGIKIAEDTDIVDTPIPYETEYVTDDRQQKGRESIVQRGVDGYEREVYEVTRRADGTESRELVLTQTVEPVTQIISVGTATRKHWLTEVYLMNTRDDRDYFVDEARTNPTGLCEQYGVTLRERPAIPTAHMRYDETTIWNRPGDYANADNYDNVELVLRFNYLADKESGRAVYNRLANALNQFGPGTRLRFSDDDDGAFRKLARKPFIEELNNDLEHWGDFEVRLILEPFRYVEQKEIDLTPNVTTPLVQPLPAALKSPQRVEHQTQKGTELAMHKNNEQVYRIADTDSPVVITDASIPYTYGGRKE